MTSRVNSILRQALALIVLLGMPTVVEQTIAVENVSAAAEMDVTAQTQVVRGVSATFGFNLQYTPENVLVRPGTDVTLGFAPGPLPAILTVDVLGLLGSSGISIPADVTNWVNSSAADLGVSNPWVLSIPIVDTPIGSYKVYSIPLYQGLPVYLDINLVGMLKADVSASAGSLERSQLIWTKWGGQDVNLTVPSKAADVTVSAAFRYSITNDYVITFEILGFEQSFTVSSFSLGEIPFGPQMTSHIEVVDESSATISKGVSSLSLGLGLGVGAAAGVVAGLIVGKRRGG